MAFDAQTCGCTPDEESMVELMERGTTVPLRTVLSEPSDHDTVNPSWPMPIVRVAIRIARSPRDAYTYHVSVFRLCSSSPDLICNYLSLDPRQVFRERQGPACSLQIPAALQHSCSRYRSHITRQHRSVLYLYLQLVELAAVRRYIPLLHKKWGSTTRTLSALRSGPGPRLMRLVCAWKVYLVGHIVCALYRCKGLHACNMMYRQTARRRSSTVHLTSQYLHG